MTTASRPRIPYRRLTAASAALRELSAAVADGPVEASLLELVRIRASQLNGCAYCLDLHTRDARDGGEDQRRLDVVAGWHEASIFDARERTALAFTEAVTLLAGRGVPDAVLDEVQTTFSPEEAATLLFAVAEINAANRLAVAGRTPLPRAG